jgi:aromatic-L-amino-acid decarboxylase
VRALGDLPPDELRRALDRVAEWIVAYRAGIASRRITPDLRPGELARAFPDELPADGVPIAELLERFEAEIAPAVVHWGHPAFLGYFGSTTTGPGIVAEALTAALNVSAMMWVLSPAATELETTVVEWLGRLVGLPAAFAGVVYDTASVATLHALAAAREQAGDHVRARGLAGGSPLAVYASDQAHSSIDKAAIVLGLGEESVRRIPSDGDFRLRVPALRDAIAEDRRRGVRPLAVIATLGTTETAAMDDVQAVTEVCRAARVWLHVDAAYGGAMAIVPERRARMPALEDADSIVVNPHKGLFVPLDFSVLFSRRLEAVREVFTLTPRYLRGDADAGERNYMDYSLQLGRRFRALKAWMVWSAMGRDGLIARVREHLRLAERFASWVEADPMFELCAPVTMGVVCFRACGPGAASALEVDALNVRIVGLVNREGRAYLTHTRLRDRVALRIGLGNVLTEERHLRDAWHAVRAARDRELESVDG